MLKTRLQQFMICHRERSRRICISQNNAARIPLKSLKYALLLTLSFFFATHLTRAQAPSTKAVSTLILHVKNVRNTTGVIRFAIFSSDNGWPDDKTKSARYGSLPANGGTVTFTIANLPQGAYAVSVFHDENENHKVDRDLFGRPKEGIGFGNNPKIGFSAPSWKQSSLQLNEGTVETTINLRYP
jgi:uncharacterized protein (DUF2141 family)